MAKKITGYIKLQVPAGAANPSPPIGPALGQRGVNIMEFCKAFNAATGDLEKSMPASISDSELPQTEAIEEEPFDSVISETTRMVYGNSSIVGITASTPRLARRPWPISRRFGPIMRPASPTE